MNDAAISPKSSLLRDVLAIHVMKRLTIAQTQGRLLSLQDLSTELGVRKADVRQTITALHREGWVDALRLRLTLAGFAVGASLADASLVAVRRAAHRPTLTKAA